MSHDAFDVAFDFVIGGHEYIESVFLDDFKVFRGVDSPLIEDTLTRLASYHMSMYRLSTRDFHCVYLFMLYSTTAVSRELLRLKVYGDIPKNSLTSFADPLSASFERVGPSAVADILVLFYAGEGEW